MLSERTDTKHKEKWTQRQIKTDRQTDTDRERPNSMQAARRPARRADGQAGRQRGWRSGLYSSDRGMLYIDWHLSRNTEGFCSRRCGLLTPMSSSLGVHIFKLLPCSNLVFAPFIAAELLQWNECLFHLTLLRPCRKASPSAKREA